MSPSQSDRNLLFGILALQMDFISRDQLVAAMNAWVLDKAKSLDAILVEQNALAPNRHALLDALVLEHLKQHGNDPQQSLAAVSSAGSIRNELERIADAELHKSLKHVCASEEEQDDPFRTRSTCVGQPTSSGLRFRILRPHARGGLGEVFVAHDEELHREVALKEIQDQFANQAESRARFVVEAEITGGLEHPGIVPVYGLGQYADGRPFYAMRFIRGDSLKDAIESFHKADAGQRDPGERTVAFRKLLGRFIDVCNAIAYAHSRGVLHRDLKPGNIMLGKYGETLVVDWGLAKTSGDWRVANGAMDELTLRPTSASDSAETQAGKALGTPAYMSPEQAAGRLDLLGPASDVYGLGATLYCLLTGRAPFAKADVGFALQKVEHGDFPRPGAVNPRVPRALEAICLKAMARKGEDRYASPRDLADDIEHWLADEPVSAWPEPWIVKTGRWMRCHKPLVSGAAAALLVGLIALTGGIIWYQGHQAEAARKQALTEQAVWQSLNQARESHNKLHAALKLPGGVQDLLNQPARWEVQIKSARADWQRAKALAANAEDSLDPDLIYLLQKLDDKLARDQADYDLALRLEKIRLDTATVVDDEFNYAHAEREYPRAFAEAGFAMSRQKETARRIQQSLIKDQLLGALDDWAWAAHVRKKPDLSSGLLFVARLADPDPWRDQVRDPALWKNPAAIGKLADAFLKDQKSLAHLSPQMLVLISILLPETTQEPWLRQAQALHSADFWLNFQLATVLANSKERAREAAGFYWVALAIRPKTMAVYNNLGNNLRDQKELQSAIDALTKAVAINDNNVKVWYNLGIALRDQKDFRAAINACEKSLAINPQYAPAWNNLGMALRAQKKLPAAIAAYNKALAINPQYSLAWNNLGFALRHQQDLPGAIAAYNKALAIDANFAEAWNNLANALAYQKDLPAAIAAFNKALAINPQYAFAWYNLGKALANQKNLAAAIDAYNKALAIDANDADTWNALGAALGDQKNLSAAVAAFTKTIQIDPNYAEAHCGLGMALRDQGDFAAAIEAMRKGHDLGSQRPGWRFPSAALVKECQKLLALEQRLPGVLNGNAASAGELLALADLCQRYRKRYRDAAVLFTKAFVAEPKQAEDLAKGYRYNAACAAALAAAGHGSGADKIDAKEKTSLRQQSLGWLEADLAARAKLLEKNPLSAVKIQDDMKRWQSNSDLAGVREDKDLARLPKDELVSWTKLWSEVAALRQKARASYTETEHQSQLGPKEREKTHHLKMVAGKSYAIDMASPQFDTYLRLEDEKGKVLDENDDISKNNLNSRIIFTAPKDGSYRIVATSFQERGVGAYTLTIREFTTKKKP